MMQNKSLAERVRENLEVLKLESQRSPHEIRAEIRRLQALLPPPSPDEIKAEIRGLQAMLPPPTPETIKENIARLKAMLPSPKPRKGKDPVKAFIDAVNKLEDALHSKRYGPFYWPPFDDLKKLARSACLKDGQRVPPTPEQKAEMLALDRQMRDCYRLHDGLPNRYTGKIYGTKALVAAHIQMRACLNEL